MKTLARFSNLYLSGWPVLFLCLVVLPNLTFAQGTTFTYQGRLVDGLGPANGTYDLQFTLYDSPTGGTIVGGPLTNLATSASSGLFTVTLDLGLTPFSAGAPRWLEIQVRTNGTGAFGVLGARQALTAIPYAITAGNLTGPLGPAALAGTYTNPLVLANPNNQFSGSFAGNGLGLTNVNAATLGGLSSSNFWQLGGNAGANPANGAFVGTTDNQPLEFKVKGTRALRLEPNTNGAPNFIAGAPFNFVGPGVIAATIGGGGVTNYFGVAYTNSASANFATVSGGGNNNILPNSDYATVSGGGANLIEPGSYFAHIGGGYANTIQTNAQYGTIAGGFESTLEPNAISTTIGGGQQNLIRSNANFATIAGGVLNLIETNATDSTISGGAENSAASKYASVAGGFRNTNAGYFSFIGGGDYNSMQYAADHSVVAGGGANQIVGSFALPVFDTISGGQGNLMQTNSIYSVIGGGRSNLVTAGAAFSTISGGTGNTVFIGAVNATIAGGSNNVVSANGATVVGGLGNSALSPGSLAMGIASTAHGFASIAMGQNTTATGNNSLAAGVGAQATNHGAFVWADQTGFNFSSTNDNSFNVHAAGGVRFVTSGAGMSLDGPLGVTGGTISGNGGLLTNVNASTLGGIASSNFWQLGGNLGADPAGGAFLGTADNQSLEFRVNRMRGLRLQPTVVDANHTNIVNVVGGSVANLVSNGVYGATIAGGGAGNYFGSSSANAVGGDFGTVSGGSANASGYYGTVGGGFGNSNTGDFGTIGGGSQNQSTGEDGAIAGGYRNASSGIQSAVGGGSGNTAAGMAATVPGGSLNTANGTYSFAAGFQAQALHAGAFVWADSLGGSVFSSSGSNQFLIRASGGVGIGKSNPATALDVNGTVTATAFSGSGTSLSGVALLSGGNALSGNQTINSGSLGIGTLSPASPVHVNTGVGVDSAVRLTSGGSWPLVLNQSPSSIFSITNGGDARLAILPNGNVGIGTTSPTNKLHVVGGVSATAFINTSDRNAKENFAPISPAEVLEKVTALPITTWSFKEMPGTRHMGPMAQDFFAAFGLGGSDTTITTVDPDGVALAAIQGLNLKLQQTEQELQRLKTQNQIQAAALRQLTAQVQALLDSRAIESHP